MVLNQSDLLKNVHRVNRSHCKIVRSLRVDFYILIFFLSIVQISTNEQILFMLLHIDYVTFSTARVLRNTAYKYIYFSPFNIVRKNGSLK